MTKTFDFLNKLNAEQRAAAMHGVTGPGAGIKRPRPGTLGNRPNVAGPLLVIAGAGTGKTNTLAHRVANLIVNGTDPDRILLLTFTRQAAGEMQARVSRILNDVLCAEAGGMHVGVPWSGTFHSIGLRLLQQYGRRAGPNAGFSIANPVDAAALMDMVRGELGLAGAAREFPNKIACLAIYSRMVNAQLKLRTTLKRHFPWAIELEGDLRKLFGGYVAAKQNQNVLDFDDLLLGWGKLLKAPGIARTIGGRFDHILVDEFQDTNVLQASILRRMKPDGAGVTVVGDDAQSIYGFRAADVRNILDFPKQFDPPATVIKLEQNYRSTAPILAASNAIINRAREGFGKTLVATRNGGAKPRLVTVLDEMAQATFVVDEIQSHLEDGHKLKHMAVLFRAKRHGRCVEQELLRRGIPFKVFGGEKFTESAHIKDVLGVLKWVENPADRVAASRLLNGKFLTGIGKASRRTLLDAMETSDDPIAMLSTFKPPPRAQKVWPGFATLMQHLHRDKFGWPKEVDAVLKWYRPYLERMDVDHGARAADLEQLAAIARTFNSRGEFLTNLTLDPSSKLLLTDQTSIADDDYLTLSTIHSCKGREWRTVFVLSVVEGGLPSRKAETDAEIDEELRLLYVAMTRAKRNLTLMLPSRLKARGQSTRHLRQVTRTRSRFIPDSIIKCFDQSAVEANDNGQEDRVAANDLTIDLLDQIRRHFRP